MEFETVRQRYRAILKRMLQRSPFRKRPTRRAPDGFSGVCVLNAEEFDRVVDDLQNPAAGPSESILRGAELLRKLYGDKRS